MKISIKAHPGAKVAKVRVVSDKLHVWVQERAINGRANRAIVAAVAEHFHESCTRVNIVSGHTSRDKVVVIG